MDKECDFGMLLELSAASNTVNRIMVKMILDGMVREWVWC